VATWNSGGRHVTAMVVREMVVPVMVVPVMVVREMDALAMVALAVAMWPAAIPATAIVLETTIVPATVVLIVMVDPAEIETATAATVLAALAMCRTMTVQTMIAVPAGSGCRDRATSRLGLRLRAVTSRAVAPDRVVSKMIAALPQVLVLTAHHATTAARVAPATPATRLVPMAARRVRIGRLDRIGLADQTLLGRTLLGLKLLGRTLLGRAVADQKLHHVLVLASGRRNLMPVRRA
jgi:hypothetical protein